VAFYDVGDAYSSASQFQPYESVGVGVRALFPWLDRTVFRADIGFPLNRPIDPSTGALIAPYAFLFSFGQAFTTPTVSPTASAACVRAGSPGCDPVLQTGQGPDSP
jgi:hypothetical protein